jgi:serine phosphatase RsbU (regulator of sigma subunit)
MRIRTQLILAFLILSVVPLSGIVLYSYVSSQRALRQAAEADAASLTSEINDRIAGIRSDIEGGLSRVGKLPIDTLLGANKTSSTANEADPVVQAMGVAAPLVESVEVISDDEMSPAGDKSQSRPAAAPAAPQPASRAARVSTAKTARVVRADGPVPRERREDPVARHDADLDDRDDAMGAMGESSDDPADTAEESGSSTPAPVTLPAPPASCGGRNCAPPVTPHPAAAAAPVQALPTPNEAAAKSAAAAASAAAVEISTDLSELIKNSIQVGPGPKGAHVIIPLQQILMAARAAKDGEVAGKQWDQVRARELKRMVDDAVRRAGAAHRREMRMAAKKGGHPELEESGILAVPDLLDVPAQAARAAVDGKGPISQPPPPAKPAPPAAAPHAPTPPAAAGAAVPSAETKQRFAEQQHRVGEQQRLEAEKRHEQKLILGDNLAAPLRSNGKIVGRITAQVSCPVLLASVLSRSKRDQGEIPFAVSSDGHLYAANEEDRQQLEALPREALTSGQEVPAARRVVNDWVIVTSRDPVTNLSFGIARPLGNSLRRMRQTAARNFMYGIGLIGLALLGILPLSRGMTRQLRVVTAGAERIAHGDLTARVPVRSGSEFGLLAQSFNRMAKDLSENQQRLVEQELQQRLLRSEFARKTEELEDARRFQLALLPKVVPEHPDWTIAVAMRTATEVGGDYYDFHLSPEGALTVAVGDATGHGAKAGTMVTAIKSLLSADFAQGGLSAFLNDAARALHRMDLDRMAMALVLIRIEHHTLTVASAGMPPVLIYRRATGAVEEISVPGLPLGSMLAEYREEQVPLADGDAVLLSTDGLPELLDRRGEPFGYPRVRSFLGGCGAESPTGVLGQLTSRAEEWCGGEALRDDLTLVAIQLSGPASAANPAGTVA